MRVWQKTVNSHLSWFKFTLKTYCPIPHPCKVHSSVNLSDYKNRHTQVSDGDLLNHSQGNKEDKNSYTGSLTEEQKLENRSWSKAALEPGLSRHPLSCRYLLLPSLVLPKMVTQLLFGCIYTPPTATDYLLSAPLPYSAWPSAPHSFWASWLL